MQQISYKWRVIKNDDEIEDMNNKHKTFINKIK